jgi:hypothetical protein
MEYVLIGFRKTLISSLLRSLEFYSKILLTSSGNLEFIVLQDVRLLLLDYSFPLFQILWFWISLESSLVLTKANSSKQN